MGIIALLTYFEFVDRKFFYAIMSDLTRLVVVPVCDH